MSLEDAFRNVSEGPPPTSVFKYFKARMIGAPSTEGTVFLVHDMKELRWMVQAMSQPQWYKYLPHNYSHAEIMQGIVQKLDAVADQGLTFTHELFPYMGGARSLKWPMAVKLVYHKDTPDPIWMEMVVYRHLHALGSKLIPKYFGLSMFRAWAGQNSKPHHFRGMLLMEYLQDFVPIREVIQTRELTPLESVMVQEAHFHLWSAGVYHSDLHTNNLMAKLDSGNGHNGKIVDMRVIDFNRSLLLPPRDCKDMKPRTCHAVSPWVVRVLPGVLSHYLPSKQALREKLLLDKVLYPELTGRRLDDQTLCDYYIKHTERQGQRPPQYLQSMLQSLWETRCTLHALSIPSMAPPHISPTPHLVVDQLVRNGWSDERTARRKLTLLRQLEASLWKQFSVLQSKNEA